MATVTTSRSGAASESELEREPEPELLVKSSERVRDLGEVLTPASTVKAMLDLLPKEIWQPHPSATFLEPACGDGNFLVAVLYRKLEAISLAFTRGALPAGADQGALHFHALQALASIYAVDISAENVIGGVPGHGIGARERLLMILKAWYQRELDTRLSGRSVFLASANWIVERNILVGNMLTTNADATASGRERLPLVEYEWDPSRLTVTLSCTTLGAVMSDADAEATGRVSLFNESGPVLIWSGTPTEIRKAPIPLPAVFKAEARNGRRAG